MVWIEPAKWRRQVLAMASQSYCRDCLAAIAVEELPEDMARLAELEHFWAMGEEFKHKQGLCARCGKQGDVVFHETAG
ncbi:MAG: hypothetical protein K0S45_1801 [Nitrospira sp.]|nr:hypothetical protein [Nitrospira sp.]